MSFNFSSWGAPVALGTPIWTWITSARPSGATGKPPDVNEVFVIMQIGNPELDAVCDAAIDPAIRDAGFLPRRVDRHNTGDLLKSEIVEFIERSQVLVADVTNERPNCYLEVGYAMGLGKKANLILTAREDHHHSSPNFRREGPKIHFDLEGYDILFWSPDDLPAFRAELANRIRRRAAIVRPSSPVTVPADDDWKWRDDLRSTAEVGISRLGRQAYMEVAANLRPAVNAAQPRLLEVIRESSIHTFGWPIAITIDNRDDYRPRPTSDGIVAEIAIGSGSVESGGPIRPSYDFWKLFRDGRFYTLLSLFEDERAPGRLFFEVRIRRVTEALLLLARIYRRLGASDTDLITAEFRHAGLKDRALVAGSRERDFVPRRTHEDVVETTVTTTLAELEADLVVQVKKITDPLFVIFDFAQISDRALQEIVDDFVADLR